MNPAVEWMSRPSRPSELLLETGDEVVGKRHSLQRRAQHELTRVEDESLVARASTSSVSSSCCAFTSMNGYREFRKTRK